MRAASWYLPLGKTYAKSQAQSSCFRAQGRGSQRVAGGGPREAQRHRPAARRDPHGRFGPLHRTSLGFRSKDPHTSSFFSGFLQSLHSAPLLSTLDWWFGELNAELLKAKGKVPRTSKPPGPLKEPYKKKAFLSIPAHESWGVGVFLGS